MADPATASARAGAERTGAILGADVDRIEAAIFSDIAGEEEDAGAWLNGEVPA